MDNGMEKPPADTSTRQYLLNNIFLWQGSTNYTKCGEHKLGWFLISKCGPRPTPADNLLWHWATGKNVDGRGYIFITPVHPWEMEKFFGKNGNGNGKMEISMWFMIFLYQNSVNVC